MLELWKPLMTLKDKDSPVLFDELCDKYVKEYGIEKSIRPFVIFYDDKINCYYYIKCRSASYSYIDEVSFVKKIKDKNPIKGEIRIKQSNNGGLFTEDSLVDCSQIFIMQKDELESLIDIKSELFKKTQILPKEEIKKILKGIYDCIEEVPPFLSILKVFINDQNKTQAESLYLCREKINNICNQLEKDQNFNLDSKTDLCNFYSDKNSKYKEHQNRYKNGIYFCLNFLKEYFPSQTNQFLKQQGLDKNFNKNKNNEKEKDWER